VDAGRNRIANARRWNFSWIWGTEPQTATDPLRSKTRWNSWRFGVQPHHPELAVELDDGIHRASTDEPAALRPYFALGAQAPELGSSARGTARSIEADPHYDNWLKPLTKLDHRPAPTAAIGRAQGRSQSENVRAKNDDHEVCCSGHYHGSYRSGSLVQTKSTHRVRAIR
jgi:hypothetical protein